MQEVAAPETQRQHPLHSKRGFSLHGRSRMHSAMRDERELDAMMFVAGSRPASAGKSRLRDGWCATSKSRVEDRFEVQRETQRCAIAESGGTVPPRTFSAAISAITLCCYSSGPHSDACDHNAHVQGHLSFQQRHIAERITWRRACVCQRMCVCAFTYPTEPQSPPASSPWSQARWR